MNQIATLLFGFISLPLLLAHFGVTLYGLWALILSFSVYFNTFSFGIPAAMSTWIAKSSNNYLKYQLLKKSLYWLLIIAGILLFLAGFAYFYEKAWIIFLLGNVPDNYISLAEKVFIVVFIFTVIRLPLSLYSQFFIGMNRVYMASLYSLALSTVNFISILLAFFFKFSLDEFAFCNMFLQTWVLFISGIHVFFSYKYMQEVGQPSVVENTLFLKSCMAFMQTSFIVLVVNGTDNLVISHVLAVSEVTPYSVAYKVFGFVLAFIIMLNSILIPAYGNSFSVKNWSKINLISNVMLKLTVIFTGVLWVSTLFFAKETIMFITHRPQVFGGYLLFFAFGLYAYFLAFTSTYSTLIQGLDGVRYTLRISWAQAGLNLLLSIILVKYIGIAGAALGTALGLFFTEFMLFPKSVNKITEGRVKYDYSYIKKHFMFVLAPSLLIAIYSIGCKNLLYKIILFVVLFIGYFLISWLMLDRDSRSLFKSFIYNIK